jgi:hypothetical protein
VLQEGKPLVLGAVREAERRVLADPTENKASGNMAGRVCLHMRVHLVYHGHQTVAAEFKRMFGNLWLRVSADVTVLAMAMAHQQCPTAACSSSFHPSFTLTAHSHTHCGPPLLLCHLTAGVPQHGRHP